MKVGYMTNAFGPLVGSASGVTSIKDVGYLTMCDDDEVATKISKIGFKYIEVLEGNLMLYQDDSQKLIKMLKKNNIEMLSICVGGNFIYQDALEDEMYHMESVAKMAQKVGAKYIVLCGGAIRNNGIQEGDCELLAKALNEVQKITEQYGLTACFHPHLGSIAEKPKEIDELFAKTNISICPDLAHLQAGGYDPMEFVTKYYDRIPFVHLKDLNEQGFAPLGVGKVKITEIIKYLLERGYAGDWLVEVDGYSGSPEDACEISYRYLEGLLI